MNHDDDIVHITRGYLNQLEEKAKKWDESQSVRNYRVGDLIYADDIVMSSGLYHKQKEKAEKWDSFMEVAGGNTQYFKENILEWKEKAKKWDKFCMYRLDTDVTIMKYVTIKEYDELREKAKKWDDYTSGHIVSLVTGEEKEKAKKWDSYTNNMADSISYLEKIVIPEFGTLENCARIARLSKQNEEKAKNWDSLWDKMEQVSSTMSVEDIRIWRDKAEKYDAWSDKSKEIVQDTYRIEKIKKILESE